MRVSVLDSAAIPTQNAPVLAEPPGQPGKGAGLPAGAPPVRKSEYTGWLSEFAAEGTPPGTDGLVTANPTHTESKTNERTQAALSSLSDISF